jgi:hypothetical protein
MSDLVVESIQGFIDALEHVKMVGEFYYFNMLGVKTFYRGQSNSEWGLSPRVYRENLFNYEGAMVNRLLHMNPNEFTGNRFDILAKMQHFGLPTRLLDCTTNPLVALYFACSEESQADKDGHVFVFPDVAFRWSTSTLIDIYMDYIFDQPLPVMCVKEYIQQHASKYSDEEARKIFSSESSYLECMSTLFTAVQPIQSTPRITSQAGAFLMFGMSFSSDDDCRGEAPYYRFSCYSPKKIKELFHKGTALIVPSTKKQTVLKQLNVLGVNEERLFPDLAHQASYILKNPFPNS